MYVLSVFAALALLFPCSTIAAATTISKVRCTTSMGPKSTSPVKTVSKVLTVPWYARKVTFVRPSKTVTPAPTTTSVVSTITSVTTITLIQETDTFSSTSTISETLMITEIATASALTVIIEVSTSTPSTTIPASAGFTPIESSIAHSQKKRRVVDVERQMEPELAGRAAAQVTLSMSNGRIVCKPTQYPQAVTCGGIVTVISTSTTTITAGKTWTKTAPRPTSTHVSTSTEIETSTVTPIRASTTLSFTETATIPSTTTTTTTFTESMTQTIQVVAPTATYYAACSANNLINSVSGRAIVGSSYESPASYSYLTGLSVYDCCVTCINTPGCGGTYSAEGECYLLNQNRPTCSQNNPAFQLFSGPGAPVVYAANGYCGHDYV